MSKTDPGEPRPAEQAWNENAELEKRVTFLRSILTTAVDGIIAIDERGIVRFFSPSAEAIFGYRAEDVLGNNVNMLMAEHEAQAHDAHLVRYRETGEKRIIGIGRELTARRSEGSEFPIELAVSEFFIDGQRMFTGIVRDISARVVAETTARHAAEELQQAQKLEAIGQLTGGIAHDFNNLLTVIFGNLEMLEAELGDESQRFLLNEAQEAAELGAELTDRLLAFARRQPLEPKLIDLNDVLRGLGDLLGRSLPESIRIEFALAAQPCRARVDPGQIENAILNLAINARDAMPDGGTITMKTDQLTITEADSELIYGLTPGTYVVMSIADDGTGMAAEIRERAFEPFFTTKEAGVGTGLGLSTIFGFAKQSGGVAMLESAPGAGTTVTIYLPATSESVSEGVLGRELAETKGQGETILVVEDDDRVRRIAVRRLEHLGYRVLEANSGPTALDTMKGAAGVDLLFSDFVLPGGMSGAALAGELKHQSPDLKVLLTSGYADPRRLNADSADNSLALLRKPYDLRQLARALRDALET